MARGSWERRRGLRTHSQLQWKSAASRAKQKRKDESEEDSDEEEEERAPLYLGITLHED